VASAIGVLAGTLLSEYINEKYLHYIAGIGFVGIGVFTLYNA
jgi:putative Ca2+/H+ antiporter (TMEM165/GDT1 family)